jgi:hypothetical protein
MITIPSAKAFSIAAERLAAEITLYDCIKVVTHFTKKNGDNSLTHAIQNHFANREMTQPVDKARAASWLSKALTGENINQTTNKLKSTEIDIIDPATKKTMNDKVNNLNNYIYCANHYKDDFKRKKHSFVEFCNKHNSNSLAAWFLVMSKSEGITKFSMTGFDNPLTERGNSTRWKVSHTINLGDLPVVFNLEFVNNEIDSCDESSLEILIGGFDAYEHEHFSDEAVDEASLLFTDYILEQHATYDNDIECPKQEKFVKCESALLML